MIQEQAISYLLHHKDSSLIISNKLDESFFPSYVSEWRYIKTHFETYGTIPDPETFLASFPAFDLIDVNEPSQYIVDELYKEHQSNNLAATFNRVRKLLLDNKTSEAVELYRKAYEDLAISTPLTTVDILKDTSRYDAYAERVNNFDKYYVRTGFPELDSIIGGWDREEELATIVARPNCGKSWIFYKVVGFSFWTGRLHTERKKTCASCNSEAVEQDRF